jgi:hypothetical protein
MIETKHHSFEKIKDLDYSSDSSGKPATGQACIHKINPKGTLPNKAKEVMKREKEV